MNSYRLGDLTVGMKERFEVHLTEEMVRLFATLSGDVNPLHVEREFASDAGYKDVVCHGMLTASFYSTLVGVHLPGRYVLLHGVDSSFLSPVFPGDTLTIEGEITVIHLELRHVEMRAHIFNQYGKKVSRAKIRMEARE